MIYGQQPYDFDEGMLFFLAPGQFLRLEPDDSVENERSGWLLLIHPDFLAGTTLSKNIWRYEYFEYAVNEALFLSEGEEKIMDDLINHIGEELNLYNDRFSKSIVNAELEALLGYADRFYHRQFNTRSINTTNSIISRLENLLDWYFFNDIQIQEGLPTVQFVATKLNISANYLSGMLRTLTGLNTQQHIHEKLITVSKQKLSEHGKTISEIAYSLGFEHVPSFNKLFKQKVNQSPSEFRQGLLAND